MNFRCAAWCRSDTAGQDVSLSPLNSRTLASSSGWANDTSLDFAIRPIETARSKGED